MLWWKERDREKRNTHKKLKLISSTSFVWARCLHNTICFGKMLFSAAVFFSCILLKILCLVCCHQFFTLSYWCLFFLINIEFQISISGGLSLFLLYFVVVVIVAFFFKLSLRLYRQSIQWLYYSPTFHPFKWIERILSITLLQMRQ